VDDRATDRLNLSGQCRRREAAVWMRASILSLAVAAAVTVAAGPLSRRRSP